MIRLITGCSRAGSKFTYKLLRELGLDGENPIDDDDPYNLVSYT